MKRQTSNAQHAARWIAAGHKPLTGEWFQFAWWFDGDHLQLLLCAPGKHWSGR
jgi:hypothetical protein